MKWQPIETVLPDIDIPVLARVAYQPETIIAIRSSFQSNDYWYEQSEYEVITGDAYTTHELDGYVITHWMHLPEPPENEN